MGCHFQWEKSLFVIELNIYVNNARCMHSVWMYAFVFVHFIQNTPSGVSFLWDKLFCAIVLPIHANYSLAMTLDCMYSVVNACRWMHANECMHAGNLLSLPMHNLHEWAIQLHRITFPIEKDTPQSVMSPNLTKCMQIHACIHYACIIPSIIMHHLHE